MKATEKIHLEREKVDNHLLKLKEQRNKLDKEIEDIKKKEDDKRKKQEHNFHSKVITIYRELLSKYDNKNKDIYFEYYDDDDDGDKKMINELTHNNFRKNECLIGLPYNFKGIIDEHSKKGKEFAEAMTTHVEMLEAFKKEVTKKLEVDEE